MKTLPALNKQTALRPLRNYRLSLLATCSVIASFSVADLSAVTRTWVGGNGNWASNSNWDTAAPNTGDDLVFNNTVTTNNNNINNLSIVGIAFGTSAGAFNLSGNALTLGSTIGLLNNNTTNIQTVSLPMTLTGATPFSTVTSGQTVITGAMSGAGGLSISGGGTLSLNNTNTYTGATTLASGTGTVNLNGSTSGTTFTIDGGRLNVNGTTTGGNFTVNAGTLGGDGAITGSVTIGSGAILDVGLGGTTDRTLAISGSVTSTGTMRFRVGGEAAGARDVLTVGSVTLSNTTLDLTFTDGSVTEMSNATQASAFLANPTGYTSSSVYQIISGTTSGNFSGLATMDPILLGALGLTGPEQTFTSGGQLFWVANTASGTYLVAVPEPSTILLSACGVLGLVLRRRR
jgi:autotransporter-associated beta strand protein